MLALRRRSRSRARSKDRAQLRKSKSRERPSVPLTITICNDNTKEEERIQPQKTKKVRNKKRSQSISEEKESEELLSEEFLTDDEILLKYRNEQNMGDMGRRRDGTNISGLSSSSHSNRDYNSKSSTKRDRSNSLKILSSSDHSLEDDPAQEVDLALEEHNEKTQNKLREQLMKECMGAIERRQKQARQLISLDEQRIRKDFDNLLKQSIKQRVTGNPVPTTKCNGTKSTPPPPPPQAVYQGSDKKKKKTPTSDNSKRNLIDLSGHSYPETISSSMSQQGTPGKSIDGRKRASKKKKSRTKSNRSNSIKSTLSLSISLELEQSLEEQYSEKKGEAKQGSTTTPITSIKDNSKKQSDAKSHKKLSTTTITELTDDTSHQLTSTKGFQTYTQDLEPEPPELEKKSPSMSIIFRKKMSSIIAAGRSRSKSNDRSQKDGRSRRQSRSKSNDRTKRNDRSKSNDRIKRKGRSNSRTREVRKTRSWGSKTTGKKTGGKRDFSEKKASSDDCSIEDDIDLKWHNTIRKHRWEDFRTMLKSYDHKKYRRRSNDSAKSTNLQDSEGASSLLQVDANGRTPLHLACKEQMPSRLLRRLLLVEKKAASVQDADGRYPLHLAVIYDLDHNILDRVIAANPDSLGTPDNLKHTPLQYAVLKADRSRGNKEVSWGPPETEEEIIRQNLQIDAYQPALSILESMVKKGKLLSKVHESKTAYEAVKLFAPPEVVDLMVILSEKILQKNKKMSERLVASVFEYNYPLNVLHRVLDAISKAMPPADLLETIRTRLTIHFTKGCDTTTSTGPQGERVTTSLAKEFAKTCRKGGKKAGKTSSACKDWWEKLRYLIARSCNRMSNWKSETVLHMALCNPKSQPSLIEYLCRLNPTARYKIDEFTGALPIHLAYMHWHPERYGICDLRSEEKVLNLLLAGDFDLVRKGCSRGRIALHYAILSGKPMQCIQILLNLDQGTISVRDPVTKLLPFQLAATPKEEEDEKAVEQLDVIYNLLMSNPL